MRRTLSQIMLAVYFALAPYEAESWWDVSSSRPVAEMAVGLPVSALAARRLV